VRLAAWNDTGHKVIGVIAYQHLTPTASRIADDLLRAHPHYQLLLVNDLPAGADPKFWAFLKATTWPDLIRPGIMPNQNEEITKYHRAEWHFNGIPYVKPLDRSQFENRQLPRTGELSEAITRSMATLADGTRPRPERAIHLSWLLHMVGDLHQPLHACDMYTVRFPDGDRGGNLISVRLGNTVVRLHSYWDRLLGTVGSIAFIENIADGIASSYLVRDRSKALPELRRATTPDAWVQESYHHAVEYAYDNGRLEWRASEDWDKRADTGVKTADFPSVDPDYAITAREIARRRAALAGVRLAELLNELLR
jgi:hypothetical protein